jgi:hypothetical protein
MHIDKKLNLVIPLERDNGETIYIHSAPIEFATYRAFALILAKTYGQIMGEGLNVIGGPGVAALMLEDVAKATSRGRSGDGLPIDWWEGENGVKDGLWAEIRRLTNYLYFANGAWSQMPLDIAERQDLLSQEEVFEVENELAFFTVFSHTPPRAMRKTLIDGMASMFNLQITSSDCTAYANSLPILTVTETSASNGSRSSAIQ